MIVFYALQITISDKARAALPNVLEMNDGILSIPPEARPLTRIIARQFDAYDLSKAGHSSAI